MGTQRVEVSMKDLWGLVDNAFILMNDELHRHHQAVGYLTFHLARAAKLSRASQYIAYQAAYLHDVGGVIDSRHVTLKDLEAASRHFAQIGANLLDDFPAFAMMAQIVRHSQTPYSETRRLRLPEIKLPELGGGALAGELGAIAEKLSGLRSMDPVFIANLIHLADDVTLMIEPDIPVLNQVPKVMEAARSGAGGSYAPAAVQALEALAGNERVWFELAYSPERILDDVIQEQTVGLDTAMQMAKLIAMIIDFRSPFTAMHSAGVAASARSLAGFCGMDAQECDMMEIAGNLHDLGKIRTPREILEKPGKLTDEEFNVIKEHAFFSDLLLSRVRGFEQLGKWASLHHEKLNGRGYPYHLTENEIPLGSKIMAVADVFSAITEDRPYRKGMPAEKVKAVLRENVQQGGLCGTLVETLIAHFDDVNAAREKASHEAGRRYYRSLEKADA